MALAATSTSTSQPGQPSKLLQLLMKGPDGEGSHAVARLLHDSSLADLGIGSVRYANSSQESLPWHTLRRYMRKCERSDGLVIFGAMVAHLNCYAMSDSVPVMTDALRMPWCLDAIDAHPAFFLRRRSRIEGDRDRERYPSNALQALAQAGSLKNFSNKEITSTLRALEAIGVKDLPNPTDGRRCLHLAIQYHDHEAFEAFISEFPGSLEAEDKYGWRPLHCAAKSVFPGNLTMLLASGVEPRPVNQRLETPLTIAAFSKRFDNTMILLGTGAFTDADMGVVNAYFSKDSRIQQLRAIHAAVQARQAIGQVGDDPSLAINPLEGWTSPFSVS